MMPIDCELYCPDVRICCTETEMTLTREDAERIDSLGYSREDYLVRVKDGFCELKNVNGNCYFYDPVTKMCIIYEARPEGCRWYPVVYHARKKRCYGDSECPASRALTRTQVRRVCHNVRNLVRKLVVEATHGESPC